MEENNKLPALPIYRSRVESKCSNSCSYCPHIGALTKQSKTQEEVDLSFEKAIHGNYGAISLSCSDLNRRHYEYYVTRSKSEKLDCIFQIHPNSLKEFKEKFQHLLNEPHVYLLINISPEHHIHPGAALALPKRSLILYLTDTNSLTDQEINYLHSLPQGILYFYFSPKINAESPYLDINEIYKFTQKYKNPDPEKHVRSLPSFDLYEPRISEQVELQPLVKPKIATELKVSKPPDISVVIPTYNSRKTLIACLEALLKQNIEKARFEIIVVDDGSTDSTMASLQHWMSLEDKASSVAFKYFYIKRDHAKAQRGSFNFHPGVARNIGVNASKGKYLLFLDSDIILPTNYIQQVLALSSSYDLIQANRLNFALNDHQASYEEIAKNAHISEIDNAFLRVLSRKNWNDIADKWRYVCTYCLFVDKKLFVKIGPFRNSFCSYGHEDTELGYRLMLAGARFHFIRKPVFHFAPNRERSEYENSYFKKRKLFFHSAQTFYCLHPHPEVYHALRWIWPSRRRNPAQWCYDESYRVFDGLRKLLKNRKYRDEPYANH